MCHSDKKELLAEEALIIRHSGEIPEIAYHGSLYYLTEDPEGPEIKLTAGDMQLLQEQVIARYKEIILRDLRPENRDKTIYRGIERCLANWRRLQMFRARQRLDENGLRKEVSAALLAFLRQEAADVRKGARVSSINCSGAALEEFVLELGVEQGRLPDGWQELCL